MFIRVHIVVAACALEFLRFQRERREPGPELGEIRAGGAGSFVMEGEIIGRVWVGDFLLRVFLIF